MAGEKAAYDSNGRIVSMISDAGEVEIASSIVAVLPTGSPVPLQVRHEGSGALRQGRNLAWSAAFTLPTERAATWNGNPKKAPPACAPPRRFPRIRRWN
ncbi:MAG: hypothetical protein WB586_10735 [Chthoniobacterales bacterium]